MVACPLARDGVVEMSKDIDDEVRCMRMANGEHGLIAKTDALRITISRARLEKVRDELENVDIEYGSVGHDTLCRALRMLEAILEGREP